MTILTEGGIRPNRIDFVPEGGNQGVTPDEPDFRPVSNRVTSFEPDLGPEQVEKAGLGDYIHDLAQGTEENSATIAYDLNQWLLDTTGALQDLSAYGIIRAGNALVDSLTIVERLQSGDMTEGAYVQPESTVEYDYNDNPAATGKEARIYTVMRGADVEAPTFTADITEATWSVETDIASEEGRSYQIDQPRETTYLTVELTDARDVGLSVVIEDEGAATTETVTPADTTAASTTTQFADIDAIEVQDADGNVADHFGDIIVSINDGDTTTPTVGEALAVLYGRDYYGNTHGDAGIPTLGATGSRGGEIARDFYQAANVMVQRPPGSPFEAAGSVQSIELSFENDMERTPRQRSRSMRQHHGMMTPTLSVTADGETISHRQLVSRMAGNEPDCLIGFDAAGDETITLPRSVVTESPRAREAEDTGSEPEFEIRAQDEPAIANEAV